MSDSKLQYVIEEVASKNREIKEIQKGCEDICNSLAHRINQIQKQTHDQVFNCKAEKSNYVRLIHHGFSASVQEWANFLIPILSENTGDNWKLVAYWDGHNIEPGLLEKYILHQSTRSIVNSYRVALESDNEQNTPIVFASDASRSSLGALQSEENPNSIFLPDNEIDLDKMESVSMLDNSEHFNFTNTDAQLYIKYEKEYPFLRVPLIERAEQIVSKEMSYNSSEAESEMGE